MEEIPVKLSELFHSLQGEGPAAGRHAIFIRLSGCNRNCVSCDTPIKDRVEMTTVATVVSRVENYLKTYPYSRVVFTGGEPFLQPDVISGIMDKLPALPYDVETNGTISDREELFQRFKILVVSPKKDGFKTGRDRIDFFKKWIDISDRGAHNVFFKVVIGNLPWMWSEGEIKDIIQYSKIDPQRLWVMPGGDTKQKLDITCRNTWKVASRLNCNYSDRLHIRTNSK